MMEKIQDPSILLVGATGAIGREVLKLALDDPHYQRVVVLTRRAIPSLQDHDKAEEHIVDFDHLADHSELFGVRDVFCGLGTTRKKAGSKARFEQIDHHYPLEVARLAKAAGASRYILISSVGATPNTWNHYLKTKGRLEEDLKALSFDSLHILRPSLLLSEREESRPGEELGQFLDKYLNFLIPKRYKGIDVKRIAERVLNIGHTNPKGEGTQLWQSEYIPLG